MPITKKHTGLKKQPLAVCQKGDVLRVQGTLSQETVMDALAQSSSSLISSRILILDLTEVTTCDSASLAFLVALLRLAAKRQAHLRIEGLPQAMQELAQVSGLLPLLLR